MKLVWIDADEERGCAFNDRRGGNATMVRWREVFGSKGVCHVEAVDRHSC